MLRIANAKQDILSADTFGGKAYGLYLLSESGYPIPESIAIQATANVDDINDAEFQKNC